ncbi:MAG: formimidoylglutamate deiminase [Polyangiaceae bacterium]
MSAHGPLRREGDALYLPALATAHSHAFQRGMRGLAQRPQRTASDDFWTWRGQMYRAAMALTPESFEVVARVAFRELHRAGVRTVGEFHYIHHQSDGTPYDDRTLLSDVVIRVAKEEGLRIALLRTAYFRAGPGREPEPGQRRFCDPTPDAVLRDVEALRAKYAGDPNVVIGLAPHSVRAVPPAFLKELVSAAQDWQLPLHMHVSEQQREVDECVQETGKRPVEFLDELGVLGPRFVAVHATCLEESESRLLGQAGAFACLCPTTERDLGDGLAPIGDLRASNVRLCIGIDSHVITDPIDDLRSLETHERLRTRKRVTFEGHGPSPAADLWREGSLHGAEACGFSDTGGDVTISANHPTLSLVEEDALLDAIVFGGHAGLFG